MKKQFRSFLQHYANGLHVYCRLCSFLPCKTAKRVTKMYTVNVQPVLYRFTDVVGGRVPMNNM